ncbi:hypothetical protein Taro_053667 [Colocasia esculenta]|uniref:Uncharacterized protein n=1 Tax=Colocasia esculenta TaxID=4460 RepID=A0A843XN93_COLES|nr:hypothetical protein [Colocasia esculenta]
MAPGEGTAMPLQRPPCIFVQGCLPLVDRAPLKRQGASSAALKHLAFLRGEKAPQGAAKAAKAHAKGAWARLDPLGILHVNKEVPPI